MIIKYLEVANSTLEIFESEGIGQPLFMFHGNSSAANSYEVLIKSELGKQYKLIAVSYPGHGGSSKLDNSIESISIEDLGRIAAKVVKSYGYSDYWLLGQSMGGHAILEALEDFPSVRGVVLVSAPPVTNSTLGDVFQPDPSDGRLFMGNLDENDVDILASCFVDKIENDKLSLVKDNIRNTDFLFRPALGKGIKGGVKDEYKAMMESVCPIAVLAGTNDKFLRNEYYDTLPVDRLWNKKVVWFEDCGHAINFENPTLFEQSIRDFMTST